MRVKYLQGTGAAAVNQVVSSKSTVVQGGALGVTTTMRANGGFQDGVAMMDMNGDGWIPDIIAGVLFNTPIHLVDWWKIYKEHRLLTGSDNASEAWGYGGNPVASLFRYYLFNIWRKQVFNTEPTDFLVGPILHFRQCTEEYG